MGESGKILISDHALERFHQRFGVKCSRESIAALLWSYPIVRMGLDVSGDAEWKATIREENMRVVFRGNSVVTLIKIGGK